MGKEKHHKVSYLKKPLAKRSFMAAGLTGAGLLLTVAGVRLGVKAQGQAGLNAGACGFCSLLVCAVGLWYGFLSLLEKEKNYILARISLAFGGILTLLWLCMIIIGLRG